MIRAIISKNKKQATIYNGLKNFTVTSDLDVTSLVLGLIAPPKVERRLINTIPDVLLLDLDLDIDDAIFRLNECYDITLKIEV